MRSGVWQGTQDLNSPNHPVQFSVGRVRKHSSKGWALRDSRVYDEAAPEGALRSSADG